MEAISLPTLVQEHLTIARTASSGRSAHTVFGGHDHRLRQTLIALAAGQELAEHESPGEGEKRGCEESFHHGPRAGRRGSAVVGRVAQGGRRAPEPLGLALGCAPGLRTLGRR